MYTDQRGDASGILLGTLSFLAVVFLALAAWALYQYHEERTTVEEQIAEAVETAREEQREEDETRFEEERRNPFRTYSAPSIFGHIDVEIPKNWNIYVEDSTSGRVQVDLFVHPDMVRDQHGSDDPYALRMELQDRLYQEIVSGYDRDVDRGDIRSRTVTVSDLEGVRLNGEITSNHEGHKVILPYRDKTIIMWTEGTQYVEEFDEIVERVDIR